MRSTWKRLVGRQVVVTMVSSTGEQTITGTVDEADSDAIALVGAETITGAPVDGRLWIPTGRIVTVQEPSWP